MAKQNLTATVTLFWTFTGFLVSFSVPFLENESLESQVKIFFYKFCQACLFCIRFFFNSWPMNVKSFSMTALQRILKWITQKEDKQTIKQISLMAEV